MDSLFKGSSAISKRHAALYQPLVQIIQDSNNLCHQNALCTFDKGSSIGYSISNGPYNPRFLPNQKVPSPKMSSLKIKEHIVLFSSKYIMLQRLTNSRSLSLLNCHMVNLDDPSFPDLSPRSASRSRSASWHEFHCGLARSDYLSGLCPLGFFLDNIILVTFRFAAPLNLQHYHTLAMAS